jgi:hypothetical protein
MPRNLNQAQHRKWNDLKHTWSTLAKELQYSSKIRFTFWGESKLLSRLLDQKNHASRVYWFGYPEFDPARCDSLTHRTIQRLRAQDRYLPLLHTRTSAEDSLHVFLRSDRFRRQFLELVREQIKERRFLPRLDEDDWPTTLRESFGEGEAKWSVAERALGDGMSLPRNLHSLADDWQSAAEALRPVIQDLRSLVPSSKPAEEAWRIDEHPRRQELRQLEKWQDALWTVAHFARDNTAADRQFLLLTGQAGGGKTHLLAELCSAYKRDGGIVIFAEAGMFVSGAAPWTQFLEWADFPGGVRDFLACVSAVAAPTGRPALICLDALNETRPRTLWRNGIDDFIAELREYLNIKLLVSCRADYLLHTFPETIRTVSSSEWTLVHHEGLGASLFEAVPKFLKAYDVRGVGIPPLTREFQVPLLLKTFCEAFRGTQPPPGSVTLSRILAEYLTFKSNQIGDAIDCPPNTVQNACRQLAKAILRTGSLWLPEEEARQIAFQAYPVAEESKSLFRALISEGILAEYPLQEATSGESTVRFTYERVWDYMISVELLGVNQPIPSELAQNLASSSWRHNNYGVITMFALRFPEEGHGELPDMKGVIPDYDIQQAFVASLGWRTVQSWSERTTALMQQYATSLAVDDIRKLQLSFTPNPAHPLNANYLHDQLIGQPLGERDRDWTLWLNSCIWYDGAQSVFEELVGWAEKADPLLIPDDQVLLLATVLAWFLTTTVVASRNRVSRALGRLLRPHIGVTAKWMARFITVDDPYVRERVLMVASGVSEHAVPSDAHLREIAALVHDHVFSNKFVEPNILIREYAREICEHALKKSGLRQHIQPDSFRPPFKSPWPRLWTETKMNAFHDKCHKDFEANRNYNQLLHSTTPAEAGGYGDWGRYVMGAAVHHFQNRRLRQPPSDRHTARFDARICQRYVIQRALRIGLSRSGDDQPIHTRERGGWPDIERLGKKYQWIGLHEFIGYLTDHYHFDDLGGRLQKFNTARQMTSLRDLLDSHIPDSTPTTETFDWKFAPPSPAWWVRPLNPFKHPIGIENQKDWIIDRETENPAALLSMTGDNDEWIALSGFWKWNEPQPVQRAGSYENPALNMFWMLRSVVVPEKKRIQVLDVLSQSAYEHDSLLQFDEPTFSSALSELRTFPTKQNDLTEWCEFDRAPGSEAWVTTCQYESHEEAPDGISGSIPSPQLAHLGNLRWIGRDFDFIDVTNDQVLFRFLKQTSAQAAVIEKRAVVGWLARTRCRLMWRFHGEKNRYSEPHGESHQRRYWASYELLPDGSVKCYHGGTHLVANRTRRDDPLPWQTERNSG